MTVTRQAGRQQPVAAIISLSQLACRRTNIQAGQQQQQLISYPSFSSMQGISCTIYKGSNISMSSMHKQQHRSGETTASAEACTCKGISMPPNFVCEVLARKMLAKLLLVAVMLFANCSMSGLGVSTAIWVCQQCTS